MSTYVLSRSASYDRHVSRALAALGGATLLRTPERLLRTTGVERTVLLVHLPSFPSRVEALTDALAKRRDLVVGLGSDAPRLGEMLDLTSRGARGYFNSYMNDVHYGQMLELLSAGQTWLVPELLARALDLARAGLGSEAAPDVLERLTPRERDVALAVGRGLSNQRIGGALGIAERTVKTHLTRIFKKLGVKNRVALALALDVKNAELRAANDG